MKRYILLIISFCAASTLEPNLFFQTQAELTRSEAARFEHGDAPLNQVYKTVLTSGDEERKRKLVKAQRAWLAFRALRRSWNQMGFAAGVQSGCRITVS